MPDIKRQIIGTCGGCLVRPDPFGEAGCTMLRAI